MAAAPQQQGQGGDNSLAPLWVTLLLFLTAGFIWYFAHGVIVNIVFHVKIWEAEFIRLFAHVLGDEVVWMTKADKAAVSAGQMWMLMTYVGEFLRYPVMAILSVLAVIMYFSNATLHFRTSYDMISLRQAESEIWPQIRPILKLNLVDTDIDEGPWAMALTPMLFAKKHKLIDESSLHAQAGPYGEPTVDINKGEAKRVFTMQLGASWDGFEKLNEATIAIFAVCAARISADRVGAEKLMSQMNSSYANGKLNTSGAKQLLKKHLNSQVVVDTIHRHAYVLCIMASMLELARHDGVVPTSEFQWLKPTDRRLYYMLNCVGRQTPYVEVSGPFAHWLAEKELGRRIMVPMVDEAVRALEEAVKEVKIKPTALEQGDESS